MIDGKNIKPGAITNTNVNSSAGVELKKLEKGSSGQIVVTDSEGTQKYVTLSGDVTIDNDGVATVSSTISSSGTGSVGPQGPAGPQGPTGPQGTQGDAGAPGSDASVTSTNVDNALFGVDTSSFGFVKRTANDTFAVDSNTYEQSFSKNTAFNKNFGTAAGDVCQGNDSRLSDSRTPTTHKSTHATGAADAIAPSDIGAEPAFTKNTAHNKNFGSTAGTVCQGNDSRLSDARTPLSHNHDDRYYTETETDTLLAAKAASGHNHDTAYLGITSKAADSDKLDGQDSTAFATASHNHAASEITSGIISDARLPIGSNATNLWLGSTISTELANYTPLSTYSGHGHGQYAVKANNLSDLTDADAARTNLNLGDSATKDVGTGSTNVAAGNHTHSTGNNGFVPAAGSSGQFLAHDGTFATPPDTNTQLSTEQVQDIVGAMFTGNTETNITATYQDDDGTIDLVASAGSGSGTVNSGTGEEMAFYAATGTAVSGTSAFTFENATDEEFNIGNGTSKGELGIACGVGSTSNVYRLYVGGSTRANAYFGTTETTPTHFVTPDAGDGAACLYGHGYVALKSMSSEPSMGDHYAGIYAKDDTSSTWANLWAVGTDGSETQISPHDENGDWIFHSVDRKRGKRTKINMIKVIRALEEVTGDQYILEEEL